MYSESFIPLKVMIATRLKGLIKAKSLKDEALILLTKKLGNRDATQTSRQEIKELEGISELTDLADDAWWNSGQPILEWLFSEESHSRYSTLNYPLDEKIDVLNLSSIYIQAFKTKAIKKYNLTF